MHLKPPFTKAEHHAGLGEDQRIVAFDLFKQAQRCVVARAGADRGIQAGDGFQIVIIDIGPGDDDGLDRCLHLAAKIGGEDFDGGLRSRTPQCLDHFDELPGPAIGQVIAVNRGDHDVLQPQLRRSHGGMFRFQRINAARHPGLDVAERTGAGANVTQDHHRGVFLGPAFADIGASRLFANRVQPQIAHQLAGFAIALAGRRFDPDPVRLALAFWLRYAKVGWGEIVHAAQIGARLRPCQCEFVSPLRRA